MYSTIKIIHISLLCMSVMIFFCRGIFMIRRNEHYKHKIFRIVPPLVDTLLLSSGITLMVMTVQYPTTHPWIAIKLTALIFYILFGTIALNRVNHYKVQVIAFIMAMATILFMYGVARTHHPLGYFLYLFN